MELVMLSKRKFEEDIIMIFSTERGVEKSFSKLKLEDYGHPRHKGRSIQEDTQHCGGRCYFMKPT